MLSSKILENLETGIIYLTLLAFPLAVIPLFVNPFVLPKLIVLFSAVVLFLLVRTFRVLAYGKLTFDAGTFGIPILLFMTVYVVSTIVRTPNKMEAIFFPGVASAVVGGSFLYFIVNGLKNKRAISFVMVLAGGLFALISILAFAGILAKLPNMPELFKSNLFSPSGNILVSVIFLATLIPLGLSHLTLEEHTLKKIFAVVATTLMIVSLTANVLRILPGKPNAPLMLGFKNSWIITADTLKEYPLFGAGPGNFLSSFNRFRPVAYNNSELWNLRFTSAQNFYLTHVAETGFVGLAVLALLLISLAKYIKPLLESPRWTFETFVRLSLAIFLILIAFFPPDNLSIFLLFVLASLVSKEKTYNLNLFSASPQHTGNLSSMLSVRSPAILVALPVLIILGFGVYLAGRATLAEYTFANVQTALLKNDGQTTYNLLRKAVSLNPYVDRYRSSYGQVNLAIAASLAQNENVSETDRELIARLVQQAIREGKATVALNPERSQNWEVLAGIYRSLMAYAQGADAFAIEVLAQAVNLDPVNPNLRIVLGGIYYSLGNYEEAVDTFKIAVLAKNDLANAHYNLAAAYREKGEIQRAIDEMQRTLALVPPDSSDYQLAKKELENLEAKKPKPAAEKGQPTTESLTPPQPAEEPVLKPPLELPEEATPPEG